MKNRRARAALVGWILALPILMVGVGSGTQSFLEAAPAILAVEAVLVAGLVVATRERSRLRAEAEARKLPVTRRHPAMHAARSFRSVHPGKV